MFHSWRGRLAVLLGICLASAVPMTAGAVTQDNNHGAAYLRVGVGARGLGMGSAQVAASDDAWSVYWNPANLSRMNGLGFGAMVTTGLDAQRRHNFFTLAYPFEFATLGVGWVNSGTKDIDARGPDRTPLGSFDQSDNAWLVSIAKGWGGVSLGATGKFARSSIGAGDQASLDIGHDSVHGFGLDAGAAVEITPFFRAAGTVQDLGTKIGDNGRQSEVPANLRLGIAVDPVDELTVAFDMEKTRDDDNYRFRLGGEYRVHMGDDDDYSGALRMGVNDGRFAGGVGIGVKMFMFDYAYVVEPEDFLNENHRFSLSLNFGERELSREDEGAVIVPTQVIHDTVTVVKEVPAPETAGGGMEEHFWFPPAHVNFKFGTAEISGADPIPVLDDVARIMTENPKVTIEIQGHTDWIGSDAYNQDLSERRAVAIRDYLIKKGIDGSRMTTRGFGESKPIDTNDTDLGRARNRRIEFLVTNH